MPKPVPQQSNLSSYIIVAALVIAIGIWVYSQLSYTIKEVDKGYQGEALTNPYLAADYFLRAMGQDVEKTSLFTERQKQLKPQDTLLVPSNRIAFDARRSNQIIQWVENGGHLIITGKVYGDEETLNKDHILDPLGLAIVRQIDEGDYLDEEDQPLSIDIVDEEEFWQVDFVRHQAIRFAESFDHEITWTIGTDNKTHGLQMKYGNGRITLLSDMKMFRNRYIDAYDHAAFLYTLTNDQSGYSEPGVFYYSLYESHISLFSWLWKYAQPLLLSFLLLLIFALWMLIPRFGPLVNVEAPVRRRFLDHLQASGNYHWRQGRYNYLLNDVRKQLQAQMSLKYPEWLNLSQHDQVQHFVDISQLNTETIEHALFDSNIERIDDFVKKIKILEKLRKSL